MTSILIFTLFCLLLIFVGIYAARKQGNSDNEYFLANRSLGWLLVGVSAAVTGNTGFIVTGAVGIGYSMGMSSLLLPIAWLFGDLLYWNIFPKKLNKLSKTQNSSTIPQFLSSGLPSPKLLLSISTLAVLGVILFYTAAQWVAAGKIFSEFFGSSVNIGILLSATLVIIYSSFGGLRSSIWTDMLQAVFILFLLVMIYSTVLINHPNVLNELAEIEGHLNITHYYPLSALIGFVLGWIFASIGFGLSQPQILIRYFAASNGADFDKAKWVYIFILQLTWIGFTFFGVLLKGILPDIEQISQENGLAIFIKSEYSPIVVGILIAAMFATISSTADSFLISTSNSIKKDILEKFKIGENTNNTMLTILIGLVTIGFGILLSESSVLTIAMNSVSYLGACIAPAVLIKVLGFKHSNLSLSLTIIFALLLAIVWQQYLGFSKYVGNSFLETLNMAVVGIIGGLVINYLTIKIEEKYY